MTKIAPLIIALALLVGCNATTPRETYSDVNDSFITAVSVLNTAKVAGTFSDEEWEEDILPLIQLGDVLLDEYDAATDAGFSTEPVVNRTRNVLLRLQPFITRALVNGE